MSDVVGLQYPLSVEHTPKGYVGTVVGFDSGKFRSAVQERLVIMADVYLHHEFTMSRRGKRAFPLPAPCAPGQLAVVFNVVQSNKLLLWNAMVEAQEYTGRELCARIGGNDHAAQRLLDLHHNSRLTTLEAALAAYGKTITLSLQALT